VNPEAPWPHIAALAKDCARAGYRLAERLPIYPEFIERPGFLDAGLVDRVHAARATIDARNARELPA
jgi:FO synthase